MKIIRVTKEYFVIETSHELATEHEKVYFFEPLEKVISVEDMQKIIDKSEQIMREIMEHEV
jgi:predicted nucleic acid-binding protein